MELSKSVKNGVTATLIAGSFVTGGQVNEHKVKQMQYAVFWTQDQIDVFEQQYAVIKRQKDIIDRLSANKEACSEKP